MKVIWKRPDGFHQAVPQDYRVIELAGGATLWLHQRDRDNFPFRVSGGWQDEDATVQLNRWVNLLACPEADWFDHLRKGFNDSQLEKPQDHLKKTLAWLADLANSLKGDTWELAIMTAVFAAVTEKLHALEKSWGKYHP